MNCFINDVIDFHVEIENWLSRGDGDLDIFLSRFSTDFSMVTTTGNSLNLPALQCFFEDQKGKKKGLSIIIENVKVVAEWYQGAIVSYIERQCFAGNIESIRYSSVVLIKQGDDILWRHLHETSAAN